MVACCKGKPKKEPVWQAKLTAMRGLRGSSRLPVGAFHWNAWFYMTVSLYMNKLFATLKYCLYMTVILQSHNYMCIDFRWSHPLSTSVFVLDLYMIVCGLSLSKNTLIYFNFLIFFFLSVQDSVDYQGRSYLHIPKDLDVKLDTDEPPERCYLPKKHIHTWSVSWAFCGERCEFLWRQHGWVVRALVL